MTMEPTPHTTDALRELARQGEVSLGIELYAMTSRVRAVAPELIGLSLGVVEDGVTLTLVSSAEVLAALDAVQYVAGGPCVAAADRGEPVEVEMSDLLDVGDWPLFARAGAAHGVACTLSLPIMDEGRVIGGVNLYGGTPDAAQEAPERVREGGDLNIALGIISADQGVNIPIARQKLRTAARRAGITEAQAARTIKHVRSS